MSYFDGNGSCRADWGNLRFKNADGKNFFEIYSSVKYSQKNVSSVSGTISAVIPAGYSEEEREELWTGGSHYGTYYVYEWKQIPRCSAITDRGSMMSDIKEVVRWEISIPIFKNTVILTQLGLAIGIPFGLAALVIVLVSGISRIILLRGGWTEQMVLFCTQDNYALVERFILQRTGRADGVSRN